MDISNKKVIPYGRQDIDETDINEIVKTLKTDYLTQGPKITEFERKLCEYTGAKYAVVVSNGTAALHLAVKVLNLKKNFRAITSPNTFVASSNCVIYNNGIPEFVDINEKTYNISIGKIKDNIRSYTDLIVPVDFAGQPCEMKKIYNIAKENNCYIIRDACHSIGSVYNNEKTGNCKYSDMTVFSFHPVKHITTGEGGAILTNNKEFYEKLIMLRTHGITKKPELMTENEGIWYYEMQDLGYNYRITDIQCALGISQLKKLDNYIKKRREIVKKYNNEFSNLPNIKIPYEKENCKSSYHLYVLNINFEKLNISRNDLMLKLRNKGILTQVHYIPVYRQPYYKEKFNLKNKNYPITENYYKKCLSLPLYPTMTNNDIEYVIEKFKELIN